MTSINYSEVTDIINIFNMLGYYENYIYNINEKYSILIVKKGLLSLVNKETYLIEVLENELFNKNIKNSKTISYICNNLNNVLKNIDINDTNIFVENNSELIEVKGNIGFLSNDFHVSLNTDCDYKFNIPTNNNIFINDLYFIINLEDH